VVLAGLSRDPDELTIHLPGSVLARTERRVLGCYFGSCNPVRDIPLVLSLYQRGELQLDELISARYRLEDITAGYADLARGRNARGLIAFMDD
jgi:Zn-dependent alcohol dehydrogenase